MEIKVTPEEDDYIPHLPKDCPLKKGPVVISLQER